MPTKTEKQEKKDKKITLPEGTYYYAVGRRKKAIAQVRLYEKGTGDVYINGKTIDAYLPDPELQKIIKDPLTALGKEKSFDMTVLTSGGGKKGQSEAIRLGVARALEKFDKELRPTMKAAGYLKRDPRTRERKKPGLKRARRAPQWSKR